jgi:hypothetical protein
MRGGGAAQGVGAGAPDGGAGAGQGLVEIFFPGDPWTW